MPKKPTQETPTRPPAHEIDQSNRMALETEYQIANQWVMHAENLSHRIFSFYVTLVTATLGGALAIGQIVSDRSETALLILGMACVILLLAGPVFYEALVRDHIRTVQYQERMSLVRQALFPGLALGDLSPGRPDGASPPDRISKLRDPYQPSSTQYTLVALIDSILVALAIPCILWALAGPGFRMWGVLIFSTLAFVVSFVAHRVAARAITQMHI